MWLEAAEPRRQEVARRGTWGYRPVCPFPPFNLYLPPSTPHFFLQPGFPAFITTKLGFAKPKIAIDIINNLVDEMRVQPFCLCKYLSKSGREKSVPYYSPHYTLANKETFFKAVGEGKLPANLWWFLPKPLLSGLPHLFKQTRSSRQWALSSLKTGFSQVFY